MKISKMYLPVRWFRMASFLSVWLGCGTVASYGQQPPQWPGPLHYPTAWTSAYNGAKPQYGYIFMRDGDTLRGKIKLVPFNGSHKPTVLFLALNKSTRKDMVDVPRYEIRYVQTYPDPQAPDSGVTEYVPVRRSDLWRKLASTDGWTIYDAYTPNDDGRLFGNKMILVGKDRKEIKIYHRQYTDFDAEVLPLIRKFIQQRYSTPAPPDSLKDVWSMIRFILDKEMPRAAVAKITLGARSRLGIDIRNGASSKTYFSGCDFREVTLLSDSTKIRLIGEILAYTDDTSTCYQPVFILPNYYMGKQRPVSKTYDLQIDALVLINYIGFSSGAFAYCPWPVLYVRATGREISGACPELDGVIQEYKDWYAGIRAKGFVDYSFPVSRAGACRWLGNMTGDMTFKKYPKWDDFYSCPKITFPIK